MLSSPASSFSSSVDRSRQRIPVLSSSPTTSSSSRRTKLLFQIKPEASVGNNRFSSVLSVPRSGSSSPTELKGHAMAVLDSFWRNQNPFVTAGIVCAVKAFSADFVAQKRSYRQLLSLSKTTTETEESTPFVFDKRRALSFVLYGALYQGVCQEFIYNNLYSLLFGNGTSFRVVAKKVLFDAIFHNLLVCVPMSYVIKSLVFGTGIQTGIRQYIDDVVHKGLMLKYYSIWMPVNAMIFTIPKHWRITVMAMVSFFWMTVLSTISSRNREEKTE